MSPVADSGWESVGSAVSGAFLGGFGALGHLGDVLSDIEQKTLVDVETATAAGADVQVELQSLVDLYNRLSGLHDEVSGKYAAFKSQVQSLAAQNAGGQVAGVTAAWKAIYESAGRTDKPDSLLGNIKGVDELVISAMWNMHDITLAYAEQEHLAIREFGAASSAGAGGNGAVSYSATGPQ